MSGIFNFPVRTSHPNSGVAGRVLQYIYDDGAGTVIPYYMLEDGVPRPSITSVDVAAEYRIALDRTDVQNVVLQSTTSGTPVTRTTFTKTFNFTDEYVIEADFIWNKGSASSSINVQIAIDGTVVKEILIEPKDPNDTQRNDGFLRYRFNETEGLSKDITLQFSAVGGSTSRIYESNVRVERNLKL